MAVAHDRCGALRPARGRTPLHQRSHPRSQCRPPVPRAAPADSPPFPEPARRRALRVAPAARRVRRVDRGAQGRVVRVLLVPRAVVLRRLCGSAGSEAIRRRGRVPRAGADVEADDSHVSVSAPAAGCLAAASRGVHGRLAGVRAAVPSARAGETVALCTRGARGGGHLHCAAQRRGDDVRGVASARRSAREYRRRLRAVSRDGLLAGGPRHPLPDAAWLARVASRGCARVARGDQLVRRAASRTRAVAGGGLVLVRGHARARDRTRAGGQPVHCRSLHLRAARGPVRRSRRVARGVARRSSRQLARIGVCDVSRAWTVCDWDAPATAALARRHRHLRAGRARDAGQLHRADQPREQPRARRPESAGHRPLPRVLAHPSGQRGDTLQPRVLAGRNGAGGGR